MNMPEDKVIEEQEPIEESQEENDSERDYESEAKEMGWRPQEQYKGDPEKWVDAQEFVERGEHILPILKANTNKLRSELLTRDQEVAKLRASVEASDKAIRVLRKHYEENQERELAQAKADLLQQLKDAKLLGDVDSEVDLIEKLQKINSEKPEKTTEIPETSKEPKVEEPKLSPEFIEWKSENSWFENTSNQEDMKRTRKLVRIAYDLRDDGDTTQGKAFFEKALGILEEREGKRKRVSKVEGGGFPSGGHRSGRSFDKLPKEAKDVCHEDTHKFVGPGKMFKTEKEWEDHYASLYDSEG